GVSGDTTMAALRRLDWALDAETDAVIVELGGNDALQGLPPEATKAALTEILEELQERNLPVLLAGMEAPRNLGKEYVTAFSAIYRELAARYNVLLYPFFLEGAALNAELMQKDGIHPNGEGVTVIVENILPQVEALLVASQGNEDG
ncbi:MAG: arylesterase, partial [Pseudomonadota bacterium]